MALPSQETLPISRTARAVHDLISGLTQWRLWSELAFRDLRRSYYGSFFGHLWITLSLGIFVFIVGNVYTLLFGARAEDYVPLLCSGLISWRLITQFMTEGGGVFLGSGGFIKGTALPLSVYLYKSTLKIIMIFCHHMIVFAVVMLFYSVPLTAYTLLVIPGLVIVILNGFWVIAVLGVLCTRFRDVQQVVSSLMILLFFITPVFWTKQMIAAYESYIVYNPLYHFLQLLRAPMLGEAPDPLSWAVTLSIAMLGSMIAFPVFAIFRTRIVFWL